MGLEFLRALINNIGLGGEMTIEQILPWVLLASLVGFTAWWVFRPSARSRKTDFRVITASAVLVLMAGGFIFWQSGFKRPPTLSDAVSVCPSGQNPICIDVEQAEALCRVFLLPFEMCRVFLGNDSGQSDGQDSSQSTGQCPPMDLEFEWCGPNLPGNIDACGWSDETWERFCNDFMDRETERQYDICRFQFCEPVTNPEEKEACRRCCREKYRNKTFGGPALNEPELLRQCNLFACEHRRVVCGSAEECTNFESSGEDTRVPDVVNP